MNEQQTQFAYKERLELERGMNVKARLEYQKNGKASYLYIS